MTGHPSLPFRRRIIRFVIATLSAVAIFCSAALTASADRFAVRAGPPLAPALPSPPPFAPSPGEEPDIVSIDPARYLDTRRNGETFDDVAAGVGLIEADSEIVVSMLGRGEIPNDRTTGLPDRITERRAAAVRVPLTHTGSGRPAVQRTAGV